MSLLNLYIGEHIFYALRLGHRLYKKIVALKNIFCCILFNNFRTITDKPTLTCTYVPLQCCQDEEAYAWQISQTWSKYHQTNLPTPRQQSPRRRSPSTRPAHWLARGTSGRPPGGRRICRQRRSERRAPPGVDGLLGRCDGGLE